VHASVHDLFYEISDNLLSSCHRLVVGVISSTGDLHPRAPEGPVDSFKTELIADRVWRTHEQAELAIVKWVGWFNHQRLHSSLGDIPPVEYEQRYAAANAPNVPIPGNGSVAVALPRAANGLTTPQLPPAGVLESPNNAQQPVPASTPPLAATLAPRNGSRSTATALPPMDMLTTIRVANIPTGATTNDRSDLKDKQQHVNDQEST
jgi:Integrase core domain